jgi:hypothetical protein
LTENPHIFLRLIDNSLVLNFDDNESYYLDLTFDVKFEVIYASDVLVSPFRKMSHLPSWAFDFMMKNTGKLGFTLIRDLLKN